MLPARRVEQEILNRVESNQISIICGGTGCGKSSQVPQILLEKFGGPILCTQPRRLAVVSVATRVASERKSPIGSEIGYAIGQRRVAKSSTSILFCTMGILLEDLRSNGPSAIEGSSVIILDECHERSAENDLVLVSLLNFLIFLKVKLMFLCDMIIIRLALSALCRHANVSLSSCSCQLLLINLASLTFCSP